jgi:hypothetical protein
MKRKIHPGDIVAFVLLALQAALAVQVIKFWYK